MVVLESALGMLTVYHTGWDDKQLSRLEGDGLIVHIHRAASAGIVTVLPALVAVQSDAVRILKQMSDKLYAHGSTTFRFLLPYVFSVRNAWFTPPL